MRRTRTCWRREAKRRKDRGRWQTRLARGGAVPAGYPRRDPRGQAVRHRLAQAQAKRERRAARNHLAGFNDGRAEALTGRTS